jgi:hypothetical protein
MASRKNFRLVFLVGVLGLALLLSGCSSSNDPTTWEEAEADGDKVRLNFVVSCEAANSNASDDGDVQSYCECSYDELREFYSDDFQAFVDAESELRNDPEAINNTAVIPTAVVEALAACERQHLA